jgi:hypothetical protein
MKIHFAFKTGALYSTHFESFAVGITGLEEQS